MTFHRYPLVLLWVALALSLSVGVLGRGYWTPDEPREADIAWRMSWQLDKAIPLLAGEPFCEKPPLTYWVSGTAIKALGNTAWVARLPNLMYALITALAVGAIGRRSVGPLAGLAAAAAISTFLLSYQVAIWLATDAPLLAAVAVALLGLYVGFYATETNERLRGYSGMHLALALGFMCKSAAAWMVPALTFMTLVIWEKRWRELLRWELYVGLTIQAAVILTWVFFVLAGPDGTDHLKVFFWNNLAGRFAHVDAPDALQYAGAHHNSPGKYLVELPVYLWPWTVLMVAAARRAWRQRLDAPRDRRLVRFSCAAFLPTVGILSVAATARNIYLAPALPGLALLLGWWMSALSANQDRWDWRALRATSVLLLLAALVLALALIVVGRDSWSDISARGSFVAISVVGLTAATIFAVRAWQATQSVHAPQATLALLLSYCALLVGPASQVYRRVDSWQTLTNVGHAIAHDAKDRPIILFAADETTRAFIDMYARTSVDFIPGPVDANSEGRLAAQLIAVPRSVIVTQMPARMDSPTLRELAHLLGTQWFAGTPDPQSARAPIWASASHLRIASRYGQPNGRQYALLEASTSIKAP